MPQPDLFPRGIRNNNPGNIKWSALNQWRGQVAPDADGFCRFNTMGDGIRAAFHLMNTYHIKDGCNRLFEYMTRYAPEGENDLEAYVKDISQRNGWPETYLLSVPFDFPRLLWAIFMHENGKEYVKISDIRDAVQIRGLTS